MEIIRCGAGSSIASYNESAIKNGIDPSGFDNEAVFDEFTLSQNYSMGHGLLLHIRGSSCQAIIGHSEISELIEFLADFKKTYKILPRESGELEKLT